MRRAQISFHPFGAVHERRSAWVGKGPGRPFRHRQDRAASAGKRDVIDYVTLLKPYVILSQSAQNIARERRNAQDQQRPKHYRNKERSHAFGKCRLAYKAQGR